ncbi:TetR/AcrR family transcriptional regulator [Mycolicibacter senuensis]|uniref:TetR/AcrR family transcriptional regulator n=1 Tax=Mycolicibacter senuensis TaxID=386913 RepID=UPI000DCF40CC|nr:TetR/AcrR family transcriptional regulator [Mycolicibacter senuensis]RAV03967.1 TetR/AcrR family transcriptional regulator [Mycolicibacter senuensis]
MTGDGRQSERDAIVRAAYRLIGRDASSTTSIENILRSARVNRRTFYRHFASKDDLIIAMQDWAGELILSGVRQAVDTAVSPPAAVAAWIDEYLSIGWDEARFRDALAFLSSEVTGAPGIAAALEATYARHREPLAEALAAGLADGSLPGARPELDAFAIHAVAVRHVEARIRGHLDKDFGEVRDAVVRLVLAGLAAPAHYRKSESPSTSRSAPVA